MTAQYPPIQLDSPKSIYQYSKGAPGSTIITLDFYHLDVNNPKYQFVQFGAIPVYAIFYFDKQFRKKIDHHGAINMMTEDDFISIESETFILCAKPVEVIDPDENWQ